MNPIFPLDPTIAEATSMSTFQPDMAPRFLDLLARREAQLQAVLAEDAAEERAHAEAHAAGAEVTDTKELAEEVTMTAVHDMQHAHAVAELEALRAARQRLEAGEYGQCASCGEPIELRRLEALPTAMRCIRCQSQAEKA